MSEVCDLEALRSRLRAFAEEREWERFHSPKNLSMALIKEAAELLEHFQWLSEQQSRRLDEQALKEVSLEMADVLIYLVRLADVLEVDLMAAAREKLAINARKYPAERVRGSARKYDRY